MPDLGNKHECPSCGTKFYDLGKAEPICPKCGVNVKEYAAAEPALAAQASRRRRKAEVAEDGEAIEGEEAPDLSEDLIGEGESAEPDDEEEDLADAGDVED
jgi:uncharacterized protein (TIGR02300 family)